jgi:hypothetical protein
MLNWIPGIQQLADTHTKNLAATAPTYLLFRTYSETPESLTHHSIPLPDTDNHGSTVPVESQSKRGVRQSGTGNAHAYRAHFIH